MLDRTHAEPALTRVAQTACDWSQFTVKCVAYRDKVTVNFENTDG